jgi:hypothetical protein
MVVREIRELTSAAQTVDDDVSGDSRTEPASTLLPASSSPCSTTSIA